MQALPRSLSMVPNMAASAGSGSTIMRLGERQWGRNAVGFSLHVHANSFSACGSSSTDVLHLLGLQRSECSFLDSRRCDVRWVVEQIDIARCHLRQNGVCLPAL